MGFFRERKRSTHGDQSCLSVGGSGSQEEQQNERKKGDPMFRHHGNLSVSVARFGVFECCKSLMGIWKRGDGLVECCGSCSFLVRFFICCLRK